MFGDLAICILFILFGLGIAQYLQPVSLTRLIVKPQPVTKSTVYSPFSNLSSTPPRHPLPIYRNRLSVTKHTVRMAETGFSNVKMPAQQDMFELLDIAV
jgi:hypothetical protein